MIGGNLVWLIDLQLLSAFDFLLGVRCMHEGQAESRWCRVLAQSLTESEQFRVVIPVCDKFLCMKKIYNEVFPVSSYEA